MQCEYCGRALSPDDWQCPGCGAPVEHKKEETQQTKEPKQEKTQREPINGPNYNKYYEQYGDIDRGKPLHISAYGGFWIRLIAYCIDMFILILIIGFTGGEFLSFLLCCAYCVIGESSICHGSTIGKKAMSLRVVNYNFETIGVGQAIIRLVSKGLSSAIFGFGLIMVMFSSHKQGLHDKLAGTYVIRIGR